MNLQTPDYALSEKHHETISWMLLIGLLFLRMVISVGAEYVLHIIWLDPLYDVCTYLLTLFLIWWERDRLALFHIDALAIVMLIVFKPLQTLFLMVYPSSLAFPGIPSLILWISAGVFYFVLRKNCPELLKVRKVHWRWVGLGLLVGLAKALVLAYPIALQTDLTYTPTLFTELMPLIPIFLYQVGMAAVSEEPLFRGFLWGHLRKAGWNEWVICLFQTFLFMLGHIYYLPHMPISFWIIVPVGGLVAGLLVWKSRTITSSMAAHGLGNALTPALGRLIAASFE